MVNDADIRVERDYLERVTAPLADPRVGLVTCLYRPIGGTFAARFEGLGVSTDFAPSALVARLVGVDEFAMGSTLAFRATDLERIGGFAAIADYLADDYQLGAPHPRAGPAVRVERRGCRNLPWRRLAAGMGASGSLGADHSREQAGRLPGTAHHQRDSVGRRRRRLWTLGSGGDAAGRAFAMAYIAGWIVMRSRDVRRLWWLIPARDLFAFAVWATGLFGNSVEWRGRRLHLDREGRIR